MKYKIIIIVGLCMVNVFLLFNRKSSWVKNDYKWYIVSILFILGWLLLFFYKPQTLFTAAVFSCFTSPAIYSIIDLGFGRLSFLIHKRDFYLWLRGSSDVSNAEIVFKASDRIFSLLLLYIAIGLPVVPLVLIKELKRLF